MITIGKTKTKTLPNGTTTEVPAVVVRRTKDVLDGSFGRDKRRALKVELVNGDLIRLTPVGTRQSHEASLFDVYRWMIRTKALNKSLEKARKSKEKIAAKRLSAKIKAADAKIRRSAKRAKQ